MNNYWKNIKEKIIGQEDLAAMGIANLVGSGLTAIFWFYLASMINPENYGEIHYFLGIAGMAQMVSLVSTANVVTVYTAKNIKIQSTLFFLTICAGIISSIIVFILFERIDVSLLILGYVIFELVNGVLIGQKLFKRYAKFFLIQKFLTLVLGISFYFEFGFEGVIYALVLSYVPSIWIIVNEFRNSQINFSLLKPRKGFILNNYGMNISNAISGQIDKIIIAPILGFELLGNYALALQFLVVMMMASNIIFKYLLTHESSGNNTKKLRIYTILFSIFISAFGFLILPEIIPIVFPEFISSIIAIQIVSLTVIPGTITLLYESKFLALEKSKFIVISKAIEALIIIIGFLILGIEFGILGLAFTILIGACVKAGLLVIFNRILINKQ